MSVLSNVKSWFKKVQADREEAKVSIWLDIFQRGIFALILPAFIASLASAIAASPGGLAGAIANLYARICLSGGACNLPALDGGLTMATVILFGLVVYLLYALAEALDMETTNADVYNLLVDLLEDAQEEVKQENKQSALEKAEEYLNSTVLDGNGINGMTKKQALEFLEKNRKLQEELKQELEILYGKIGLKVVQMSEEASHEP